MITISDCILTPGGRSTGFGYLLIVLAVGAIVWHSFLLYYVSQFADTVMAGTAAPAVAVVLPVFFALSAFLVVENLGRSSACVFSVFFWTVVEKPALKLKKLLPHVERGFSLLKSRTIGSV